MKLTRLAVMITAGLFFGISSLSAQVIFGHVIDYRQSTDVKPVGIPGVRVSVMQGGRTLVEQTTGIDGAYGFDSLPKGVPLSLKFDLPGYLRHPTIRSATLKTRVLELNVPLLKQTDVSSSDLVATRLQERLARKGADYETEMKILNEFGLALEEREAILAHVNVPPGSRLLIGNNQPAIAVLTFENKTDSNWWSKSSAATTQNALIDELVKSGEFSVVERDRLAPVMQTLPPLGNIDPQTAIRIGKLLGVNYLLTGAVTEYSVKNGGGFVGIFNKKRRFVEQLDAKLIDTRTGELVWSGSVRQEDAQSWGLIAENDNQMFDKIMKSSAQELVTKLKKLDLKPAKQP